MLNLDIRTIVGLLGGNIKYPEGYDIEKALECCICGAEVDSRKVEPGFIFVAAKGDNTDGHAYIDSAVSNGAIAVICEKIPDSQKADTLCIVVEDSYEALRTVAKAYREKLGDSVKVVAITGSVGKTSTKEFIASVIEQKYRTHKTKGNRNSLIGLPMEILSIQPDTEVAVLELGISENGEMERLSAMACPDIAVITNIGNCHLDKLVDRDGVLNAKSKIFSSMKKDGFAVLNGLDDKLSLITDVMDKKPYRFGDESLNVWATDIKNKKIFGSSAIIHIDMDGFKDQFPVDIALPGNHMISNAMTATIVGKILGLSIDEIKHGIEATKPLAHRSCVIKTDKYTLIDDCYNANASSMKAAVDMLMQSDGRKVAILGDMFELGEKKEELHKEVGRYAADKHVEVMVFVGTSAEFMRDGAREALVCEGQDIRYFATKDELYKCLDSIVMEGDTILVKASRGMKFETILEKLQ